MSDILVNGNDISTFGGASLLDYVVGQTPLVNDYFQGTNNSVFVPLHSEYFLRDLYVTILFEGMTLRSAKTKRSSFNRVVYKTCELYIPDDGFYYTCSCVDLGDEELVGIGDTSATIKSKYHFKAMRHDPLETVTATSNEYFTIKSTVPYTAARITVSPGNAASSFYIAKQAHKVTFNDVPSASQIVMDGINQTLRVSNTSWLQKTTWYGNSPFIMLSPGRNLFTFGIGNTPVFLEFQVEYYPTYL